MFTKCKYNCVAHAYLKFNYEFICHFSGLSEVWPIRLLQSKVEEVVLFHVQRWRKYGNHETSLRVQAFISGINVLLYSSSLFFFLHSICCCGNSFVFFKQELQSMNVVPRLKLTEV